MKSYYLANVRKAKKAKEEREALREENSKLKMENKRLLKMETENKENRKLKMENERLLHQNGELLDTVRMASLMGCFENLDKAKSKDGKHKMLK